MRTCRRTHLGILGVVAAALLLAVAWSAPAPAAARYTLSVDVDYASATYEGIASVSYTNDTPEALSELFFRLYPNAATLYAGSSAEVLSARVGDVPTDTALFVDDTVLMVALPETLLPAQTATVTLTFRGRASLRLEQNPPLTGEYGILTRTPHTLVLTSFYPLLAPYLEEGWALDPVGGIGDALFSEASPYDVTIRIDRRVTPIATGFLVDATPDGDAVVYRYAADQARDFSVVLTDDGRVPLRAAQDGVALRIWFQPGHDVAAARAVERAVAAVRLYTSLIGPLPYDEVDLVEAPLQHVGGVELTGLVLLSDTYTAAPYDVFFDILVSHELAHEWFYAAVGNDPVESPWLDEGLVTYLSNVFLAASSPDIAAAERDRWARAASQAAGTHPELSPISPLYGFPDSATYSALAYSGAAAGFHALRTEFGDAAFFTALSEYYRATLFTIATPLDLRRAFEAACGCDVDGILFPRSTSP